MSIITKMLRQTAVYWEPESTPDQYGRPVLLPPIEILCRWEDKAEQFIDAEGNTVVSKALVYVGQDVELGGVLMLGDLDDVDDPSVPKNNDGAWEIRNFSKAPNLKATEYLRTAYL